MVVTSRSSCISVVDNEATTASRDVAELEVSACYCMKFLRGHVYLWGHLYRKSPVPSSFPLPFPIIFPDYQSNVQRSHAAAAKMQSLCSRRSRMEASRPCCRH